MVKILILALLVYILFVVSNNINKNNPYSLSLYILHAVIGIVIALIATGHALTKINTASTVRILTGGLTILCLYVNILIGYLIKKKHLFKLNGVHRFISVFIIFAVLLHIFLPKILLKMMFM